LRIDSHQHFWNYDPVKNAWITEDMGVLKRDFAPSDLYPLIHEVGINATIAVQADQSEAENYFLLHLSEKWPAIVGIVGWVDFCADNIVERLAYFKQFPRIRGFRHVVQDEPDKNFLLRNDFMRGIASLGEFGLTYDLLVYVKQLPAAVDFVQRFPDQPFVIDHLAKPALKANEITGWARYMQSLASNQNVYCKVSGLITEADWSNWRPSDFTPYLDVVFDSFGVNRVMFGSDWPVCLLAGTYHDVVGIVAEYLETRPSADKEKVFGGNAARFYGVPNNSHSASELEPRATK
jgi:L-fuconolactonase